MLGGVIHEQATSRWHKVAAWTGFAGLPDAGMARFLEPFSSPHRMTVIRQLARGVSHAGALQQATGMTSGRFYHHLHRLAEAGYVLRVSPGKYALAMRGKVALACLAAVCELLEQWPQQLGERRLREEIADDESLEAADEAGDEKQTEELTDEE